MKKHIFIVGCKGIPSFYGGFETFVDKLTEYHKEESELKYHIVFCGSENKEYEYNNAHCKKIKTKNFGPAQAVINDIKELNWCIKYIQKNKVNDFCIYILGCKISILSRYFYRKIKMLGGKLYINPDGHEFLRKKWPYIVRKYLKYSEKEMVSHCDKVICDSISIENYIKKEYESFSPRTCFIAYGAEYVKSNLINIEYDFDKWIDKYKLRVNEYYLVVGRFVPENNYEVMIREFMKSKTTKDFVIICTKNDKLLESINIKLNFKSDKRVKFVGTVYNKELLKKIRECAFAYVHGHEVGGTNPSLLEALGSTHLNLLLDVGFNREVAEDTALYWNKKEGNFSKLVDKVECLSKEEIHNFSYRAKDRIKKFYSWKYICNKYKYEFLS